MTMNPYIEHDYSAVAESAALGLGGFVLFFVLLIYLLLLAFCVVSYVLTSVGTYTIARRRGIHNAWLAWIPVGSNWLLGSISDQYQYVAKGRVRNRRKVLLGLSLSIFAVLALMLVGVLGMVWGEISGTDASEVLFGGAIGLMLICYLAMFVVSIVLMVFQYIALYDLFASCDPENSVLYLVIGILFGVTLPFFVFTCRNKDKGMPPRRTEPREIPVAQGVLVAEEPTDTEV